MSGSSSSNGSASGSVQTVPAGASVPMSLDDWTGGEWFVVIAGAVLYGLTFVAVGWLWLNRRVRYVKVLAIELVFMSVSACALYWFGSLTSLRIIPQRDAFLVCPLWNIWIDQALSICMVFTTFNTRLWRLHVILVQRKRLTWRSYWLPALIWMPSVFICIIATAMGGDGPTWVDVNGTLMRLCFQWDAFAYTHIAHLIVLAITGGVLAFQLHRVRHRIYQEYSKTLLAMGTFFVAIIIIIVILKFNYQFLPWGRVTFVCVVIFATMVPIWVIIGPTVFNLAFRHEFALKEFEQAIANKVLIMSNSTRTGDITSVDDAAEQGVLERACGGRVVLMCCPTSAAAARVKASTSGRSGSSGKNRPESAADLKLGSSGSQLWAQSALENVDDTIRQLNTAPSPRQSEDISVHSNAMDLHHLADAASDGRLPPAAFTILGEMS